MKWVTILEVGGEGGSITLLGQDNGDGIWKFVVTTDESTLKELLSKEDAEGINFTSTSAAVDGWDDAIELLGRRYPGWMRLYPQECHPLFRERVWKLLSAGSKTSKMRDVHRWMRVLHMESDIENAGQLFRKAGFDLPAIPEKFAASLKQQSELDFSSRKLPKSVNYIDFYVNEANTCQVDDYAVLSRAIWSPSVNTIHYFLVSGPLRMFLQLCWGGFRIEEDELAEQIQEIRHCFSLADQIVPLAMAEYSADDRLTIVTQSLGSNNYWAVLGQDAQEIERRCNRPKDVLGEVLQWLEKINSRR